MVVCDGRHFAKCYSLLSRIVALALILTVDPTLAQTPAPVGPNVIIILADDLGSGDVGAFGATDIVTPNIDRIANEGVMLGAFYTAPSCSLSRTMLITGSYAPRSRASRNYTPSSNVGIHPGEITLGEVFQSTGYATGLFGKWHLGDHYQFMPQRHGFDEFYGIPYSNNMWPFHPRTAVTPNEDPRLTAARQRAEFTGYAGQGNNFRRGEGYPNLPLYDNDTIVEFNSQQEDFGELFIDRALDFIERHSGERFFAYIPLIAPHVPLHPGPAFVGTSTRDLYGDTVQEIDHGVGLILAKLVELGIDNETLVIFLSDNGPWLQYGIDGGSAGPLSRGKETQYEGGIRVPAMMRWPGGLPAGSTISEPLGLVDILPTLAELAGASLPSSRELDGIDVWPLLSGQASSPFRQAPVCGFDEANFGEVELGAIRSGDWKLHVNTSGRNVSASALYNLQSDIGETTDLRSSQSGVVSSLIAHGEQLVADILDNQRPLGVVALSGDPFAQFAGVGNLISMEAEHYHLQDARGGKSWQIVSLRHSSAEESLQALPKTGTNIQNNYDTQSPHLGYRAIFESPGRYYVWVRARAASASDDSLHIGLNGQAVPSGRWLDGISDYWVWTSTLDGGARAYVDVPSAGEHVFDVWMREDGVIIDKIVLTTDAAFVPKGQGIVESRQSYDGLAIPPTAADDGPHLADEGGAVQGAPNVLDNDGMDPRNDPIYAELVSPPLHASVFELLPEGTFTYVHDGSETVADSFTYTANDVDGASNIATASITIIPINDPPVITLRGQQTMQVDFGDTYVDAGATARDAEDGDLSASIIVGGDSVNTSALGAYIIAYDVIDSGGAAAAQISRVVQVVDGNPPVITLLGSATLTLTLGSPYVDAGATALDPEEGDLTSSIVIGGDTVDTSVAGAYVVTYNATDSSGNAAEEVTRRVDVANPPPPILRPSSGGGGIFGLGDFLLLATVFLLGKRARARPMRRITESVAAMALQCSLPNPKRTFRC